jgi:hypothetical protein
VARLKALRPTSAATEREPRGIDPEQIYSIATEKNSTQQVRARQAGEAR